MASNKYTTDDMSSQPPRIPDMGRLAEEGVATPLKQCLSSSMESIELSPPRLPYSTKTISPINRATLRATISYNVPTTQRFQSAVSDLAFRAGYEINYAANNPANAVTKLNNAITCGASMSAEIAGSIIYEGRKQGRRLLKNTGKILKRRVKNPAVHGTVKVKSIASQSPEDAVEAFDESLDDIIIDEVDDDLILVDLSPGLDQDILIAGEVQ